MNILQQSGTDFFLTGGTALSRAYYNHRYSDDLDFFLNNSDTYGDQLDNVLDLLSTNGYFWTKKPSWEEFHYNIEKIVQEMIGGET